MVDGDGAPRDLQPGGRSSTAGAHTPPSPMGERWYGTSVNLRAGERLTSAWESAVGCLMSGAEYAKQKVTKKTFTYISRMNSGRGVGTAASLRHWHDRTGSTILLYPGSHSLYTGVSSRYSSNSKRTPSRLPPWAIPGMTFWRSYEYLICISMFVVHDACSYEFRYLPGSLVRKLRLRAMIRVQSCNIDFFSRSRCKDEKTATTKMGPLFFSKGRVLQGSCIGCLLV